MSFCIGTLPRNRSTNRCYKAPQPQDYINLSNENEQEYSRGAPTGGAADVYEPARLAEVTLDEALIDNMAPPILRICLCHRSAVVSVLD
jgi:hypothetical protein